MRTRSAPRALLALVLVAPAAACTRPATPAVVTVPGTSVRGVAATVAHVVDGDTVDLVVAGGGTERARLLGIDTPETVKPDAPVECFGPEASARTKALLPEDTAVVLQRDEEARDRYGRLLVYVWRRDDGLFVNGALVADGYARTLSIAPNRAHAADLAATAADARARRAGLWGACPAAPGSGGGPGG